MSQWLTLQVEFPPDLCSRVTFVNFTVTRGSLQSQCLNQVLKAERPDVDAKRSDLLKLQGQWSQGTPKKSKLVLFDSNVFRRKDSGVQLWKLKVLACFLGGVGFFFCF